MTPKEQSAMQQALEAIGDCSPNKALVNAAYALREALAGVNMSPTEQAEQEPVGYLCEASFGRGQVFWFNKPADNTPLYAAPVRTKDLTDDDLNKLMDYWSESERSAYGGAWAADDEYSDIKAFARAVIAADREKNK